MFGHVAAHARAQRIIQASALGLGIGLSLISIHGAVLWTDGRVYWEAGERLLAGEPLYPAGVNPDTAFKYAPWFAVLWAPLTVLPEPVVAAGWTLAMVGAWAVPMLAYFRSGWRQRAIMFLASPPLLVAALGGNVQPAIIALLFVGLQRRWGPAAIGVAASVKLFPILFVTVYLARREWVRAAVAVALSGFLWLPALASEARTYPSDIGGALSLLEISPLLYAAAVLLAVAWTLRSPSWQAAGVAVVIGSSIRFIPYHLGYLLCSRPLEGGRTPGAASGSSTAASTG
jgi:hypothetical protein